MAGSTLLARGLLVTAAVLQGISAQDSLDASLCLKPLSTAEQSAVVKYVKKKLKLPDSLSLTLANDEAFKGTCFRKLTFKGESDLRTWDFVLYTSPDRRFVTSELLDIFDDPVKEEQARNRELMSALSANHGTSLGPALAPVSIVVFSDFQCPFCKKFAAILREVLATNKEIRVVFHHLPLSIHPWARIAAEAAACAQLQGPSAFWNLHDVIFENQGNLNPENAKEELIRFAAQARLDFNRFTECFQSQMSLGLVFRDLDLASAYKITSTPTVFINGKRISGVKDGAELRRAIADAGDVNADNASDPLSK